MRVRKFLKSVFGCVCGQVPKVATPLPTEPVRKEIIFFPCDGSNQPINMPDGMRLRLTTTANPDRLNNPKYRVDCATMAVLRGIRMNRLGILALCQIKGFNMEGYPQIAAVNVISAAHKLAHHPEFGPKILGDKLQEGRVILEVAMRSSLDIPEEAKSFGGTVHADLVDRVRSQSPRLRP